LWRASRAEKSAERKSPWRWAVPALGLAAVVTLVSITGGGKMLGRFSHAISSPMDFLQGGHYRVLLRELGKEMWLDRPAFGWGGGAYLYLFNSHHNRVPEVAATMYREQPNLNRLYMVSADCDWMEFLVEYGAVGVGLLLVAAGALAFACWGWDGWKQGLPFFITLGASGLALHAWYDHVLRNQALLVLFLSLLVVGTRLAAPRETQRKKRTNYGATRPPFPAATTATPSDQLSA
jgi:O-antigen ligase